MGWYVGWWSSWKGNPGKIKARRYTSQITWNLMKMNSPGGLPETWTFYEHRVKLLPIGNQLSIKVKTLVGPWAGRILWRSANHLTSPWLYFLTHNIEFRIGPTSPVVVWPTAAIGREHTTLSKTTVENVSTTHSVPDTVQSAFPVSQTLTMTLQAGIIPFTSQVERLGYTDICLLPQNHSAAKWRNQN